MNVQENKCTRKNCYYKKTNREINAYMYMYVYKPCTIELNYGWHCIQIHVWYIITSADIDPKYLKTKL